MAVQGILLSIPGTIAGADLSAAQFLCGMLDGAADYSVVVSDGTAGIGVIQTNPPNVGESVQVAMSGLLKVVGDAAIVAGTPLFIGATGQASAAGTVALGVAMSTTTAAGELVEVLTSGMV